MSLHFGRTILSVSAFRRERLNSLYRDARVVADRICPPLETDPQRDGDRFYLMLNPHNMGAQREAERYIAQSILLKARAEALDVDIAETNLPHLIPAPAFSDAL